MNVLESQGVVLENHLQFFNLGSRTQGNRLQMGTGDSNEKVKYFCPFGLSPESLKPYILPST